MSDEPTREEIFAMADLAYRRAMPSPFVWPEPDPDPLVAALAFHRWWWDPDRGHICNCGWTSELGEEFDDGRPVFIARHLAAVLREAGLTHERAT